MHQEFKLVVGKPRKERVFQRIDRYFELTKRGSTIRTEIFAGLSTFLALSYIFIVNPAILAAAGMPKSGVFFATIVGSVLATLAMGLWANLPFAVAPGLEMNAFVAYVVAGSLGFSWQEALGAVCWSGLLTVAFNYTGLRVKIIDAIPDTLKSGLAAAVGIFLMLIALKVSGLLTYQGIHLIGVGRLLSPTALIFGIGLALAAILRWRKVPGAIILSIAGAALAAHWLNPGQTIEPIHLSKELLAATGALKLSVITNPKIWSVILVLFILDFYGSIAKFIGLTSTTSIVDADGNVPKIQEALTVDGAGTVLGAALGTSNLITYVESAVGIGEGGRTGLTAITCAALMSLMLFLTPLVNLVPVVATTGALFYVGTMLLPKPEELKVYSRIDQLVLLITILSTIVTFGLDKAMLAAFGSYLLLTSLNWPKLNPYLVGSTLALLASVFLPR